MSSTNLRVYSESHFYVKHEGSDKNASVLKTMLIREDFVERSKQLGMVVKEKSIANYYHATVIDNNHPNKAVKVVNKTKNESTFERTNSDYVLMPGERVIMFNQKLNATDSFKLVTVESEGERRISFEERNFEEAETFYNTRLPNPKEEYYSEEGMTDELLEEIYFAKDNESDFFQSLNSEYPQLAKELRKFIDLKLPNGLFKLYKTNDIVFAGQLQGKKQKGIGAIILENKFAVGACENFKIHGPGRFYENDNLVYEGIFKDNLMIEMRSLDPIKDLISKRSVATRSSLMTFV